MAPNPSFYVTILVTLCIKGADFQWKQSAAMATRGFSSPEI